jgi:ribose 5-phosphate isomerase A
VSPRDLRRRFKAEAARAAVAEEVRDGMVVGLGTGTTAAFVVRELARRVREEGWRIQGVATSARTAASARRLGIPLVSLEATPDVALDGADQVDPQLNLLKGGGGAHVRERLVALSARRVAIVADFTKAVPQLRGPVPLEVLPFALPWVQRTLAHRFPGATVEVRLRRGRPWRSDNGNLLADLHCGVLPDPAAVAHSLDGLPGLIGHGLFIGIAHVVYLAGPEGIRRLARPGE